MNSFYKNYYWKKGIPVGKDLVTNPLEELFTYKIIIDPYYKRISLEKYKKGIFTKVIYDSNLLDFRHLRPNEQASWLKIQISGSENQPIQNIIKNQDDRAILLETYDFYENYCIACHIAYIQQLPLATQRIFYKKFNHPFDGVVLYDMEDHPVMIKIYAFDEVTQEFGELKEEIWDMALAQEILPR